jgi:hypothetical protein
VNRVREDEQSGQTNLIPDGATVHVVSIILFIWLIRVIVHIILLVSSIIVVLFVIRAMLADIPAWGHARELCTESMLRVWKLTTESSVVCKVRAWKLWDLVFCEQPWRVLGYVVVVTLGLILGGAVAGALVLRYCETGIGELALHVSCKPLLLVTLLSAIGNPCVRSLWS